jgi:hypothetical protein
LVEEDAVIETKPIGALLLKTTTPLQRLGGCVLPLEKLRKFSESNKLKKLRKYGVIKKHGAAKAMDSKIRYII